MRSLEPKCNDWPHVRLGRRYGSRVSHLRTWSCPTVPEHYRAPPRPGGLDPLTVTTLRHSGHGRTQLPLFHKHTNMTHVGQGRASVRQLRTRNVPPTEVRAYNLAKSPGSEGRKPHPPSANRAAPSPSPPCQSTTASSPTAASSSDTSRIERATCAKTRIAQLRRLSHCTGAWKRWRW